ncbi:hypothetical protein DOH34_12875 [Salmonella enterica subsp. enterica serovar Wangata]|nr:hypothetical protein [Salmonella enterica subsp. enterica serovar Wangata]
MYSVKQIMNHAMSLYDVNEITIARPGSEQFAQAFEMAHDVGLATPDVLEFIPPCYEDPEMTKEIEGEHVLSVERDTGGSAHCIAVLCYDLPSNSFPDTPEAGGVRYQFVYDGDQVYVMNQAGSIIEVVK